MDRGAWAIVHGVTKNQTQLKRLCTHAFQISQDQWWEHRGERWGRARDREQFARKYSLTLYFYHILWELINPHSLVRNMYSWWVCESQNKQQQKSVKRETIHRKKRSWFFSKSCEHLAQWFLKCDPEIYWHLYDLCRASTGQNGCHEEILYWLIFSVGSCGLF